MGAPRRPAEDELLRRMAAWAGDWQAVAGSTEPADRPRAEAAVRSLYRAAGAPEPAFAWVPSPAAGILAYTFASTTRPKVVSPWARGDVGNGDNRQFNGLARPFGMEPAWVLRLAAGLVDRVPPPGDPPMPCPTRSRRRPPRCGLTGRTGRWRSSVAAIPGPRWTGALAMLSIGDPPSTTRRWPWPPRRSATPGRRCSRRWAPTSPDRCSPRPSAGSSPRCSCRPGPRRDALQAMQPGQWDTVTPVLASVRDVFGGYLWRPQEGRAEREAQIDARLEVARSAGPWWALGGLAIISERPLVLHRDDRGARTPRTGRRSPGGMAWRPTPGAGSPWNRGSSRIPTGSRST